MKQLRSVAERRSKKSATARFGGGLPKSQAARAEQKRRECCSRWKLDIPCAP